MVSQPRPLFDSSVDALVLINARNIAGRPLSVRTPARVPRLTGGRSTTVPIRFAPEPDPTTNVVDLGQEQSTGPLPLGFEFEFFGVRYTMFDLSSDRDGRAGSPLVSWLLRFPRSGLLPHNVNADRNGFIALGWTEGWPRGWSQVAYEVRGLGRRRRLVLSFTRVAPSPEDGAGTITAQLVLHERTGMIDVHTRRRDAVATEVKEEAVRFTTSPP